jgi:hypothetical protein
MAELCGKQKKTPPRRCGGDPPLMRRGLKALGSAGIQRRQKCCSRRTVGVLEYRVVAGAIVGWHRRSIHIGMSMISMSVVILIMLILFLRLLVCLIGGPVEGTPQPEGSG